MKKKKWLVMVMLVLVCSLMFGTTVCAAGTGDVAGAIEGTWKEEECRMEVKTYTIDEIKNIVTPIAEKYQIAQVYLFGSFARGDFDEQSDIDIRIEKGNLKGMFALCGFYTEVSDALGRKVDVLTTGSLSDEFLESIKKDEVMLYAGQ